MKTPLRLAAAVAAASLLAGCCACRSIQKKSRRPLEGTRWQLVQLDGREVRCAAGAFTLRFDPSDHAVSGTGACNRLMGRYETNGERVLKIGSVAATRMACPGQEREGEFIRTLETTTHYDMDGAMLLLFSDGELRAILQALPDEK